MIGRNFMNYLHKFCVTHFLGWNEKRSLKSHTSKIMTKKTTRDEEDICSKKSQRIQAIWNIAKLVKKSGLNRQSWKILKHLFLNNRAKNSFLTWVSGRSLVSLKNVHNANNTNTKLFKNNLVINTGNLRTSKMGKRLCSLLVRLLNMSGAHKISDRRCNNFRARILLVKCGVLRSIHHDFCHTPSSPLLSAYVHISAFKIL